MSNSLCSPIQDPKPLVFIGHSLGGLIVKSALLKALQHKADEAIDEILTSTRGIAFFGTPHSGTLSGLQATLRRLDSTKSVLAASAGDMQKLIINFASVVPHIPSCKVVSFYEEHALSETQGPVCIYILPITGARSMLLTFFVCQIVRYEQTELRGSLRVPLRGDHHVSAAAIA